MHVVIPARYQSTRLPGKPLLDIAGKPLIERVYECARTSGADNVIIATDDPRIGEAARAFGAQVCMTAATHRSGTERIAEVVRLLHLDPDEVIVNLQGDEPLMPSALIGSVADALSRHAEAAVSTAMHAIDDPHVIEDPNVVKVVCDANGFALYFSRAPIPWPARVGEGAGDRGVFRHIGLYAYRAGFVTRYASWPACPLEQIEALEQLRVLWHGERIYVHEAAQAPQAGVDTAEDLERVRRVFNECGGG